MREDTSEGVVQKNEFRFVGMSRSGNHAIINWILDQLQGNYLFLNCAEPKYNPFTSARPLEMGGKTYLTNISNFEQEKEIAGNFSKKEYLLYSYEDCFLGGLNHSSYKKHHDEWVGKSANRKDILIMRDPFNLFASRIKSNLLRGHYSHGSRPISILTVKRIYKQHAREFLGKKNNLKNLIPINYNKWVESEEYREKITAELGIDFTDKGFHEVSKVAGGSSFDGTDHSGQAYKMDLHNRWKKFANDEEYWELFDTELIALTSKIFGEIAPLKYYREKMASELVED